MKWIERIFLGLVLLFLGLGGLGYAYQTRSVAEDRAALSIPGRLVRVDGFGMHLHCTGRGEPTILLEAGTLGFSQSWAWVQEDVGLATRVCSYDRAGMGWSEDWGAHDGTTVAHNLRALLRASGEEGPFVVVGHSLGGAFVRIFAGTYRRDVVGVAMVDPYHPDQLERFGPEMREWQEGFHDLVGVGSKLARVGGLRVFNVLGRNARGLPDADLRAARFFVSSPDHLAAAHAELAAWEKTMDAARRVEDLGDIPLVVISPTEEMDGMARSVLEVNHEMHRELAGLSTQGRHVLVSGADHLSLLTRREHARDVALHLRALVAENRYGEDRATE